MRDCLGEENLQHFIDFVNKIVTGNVRDLLAHVETLGPFPATAGVARKESDFLKLVAFEWRKKYNRMASETCFK